MNSQRTNYFCQKGQLQAWDSWEKSNIYDMATPTGLEPAISSVTGKYVNQLHHGATFDFNHRLQNQNYNQ